MAATLYGLKPRFQALLRPAVSGLAHRGVTANHVTLSAVLGSVILAGLVAANATSRWWFLLLAVWHLFRMALNAIDGMLAREFDQKSALGAYLNEISDVVSDAALCLPFALIEPFSLFWVVTVVFLAALSEFAGALGPSIGASRRYDGPMGKSDRAVALGVLALAVGLTSMLPHWMAWVMPALALLLCLTIVNRVRAGLREANEALQSRP